MRPGYYYAILSQNVLTESGRERIQNVLALLKVYKPWKWFDMLFFFANQDSVMQIPVPKGKTVIGNCYKMLLLENWTELNVYYESRRPKTGIIFPNLFSRFKPRSTSFCSPQT